MADPIVNAMCGLQLKTPTKPKAHSTESPCEAYVVRKKHRVEVGMGTGEEADWQLCQTMSHVTIRRAHPRKAKRDNKPYPRQLGSRECRQQPGACPQDESRPAPPTKPKGFKAPIPSAPFDDEAMFDPWAFNHDLHMPHSARRNDTAEYERETFEALRAARTMRLPSTPKGAFRMARFYGRVDHAKQPNTPLPGEPMDLD